MFGSDLLYSVITPSSYALTIETNYSMGYACLNTRGFECDDVPNAWGSVKSIG